MRNYRDIVYQALYVCLFALYFLQYPLNISFPGNTDAIGHLAIFYDHWFNFKSWLGLGSAGNMFYPAAGIAPYVESYLGETVIFFLFRTVGLSDIWAAYAMTSLIYALNGIAVYLLARYYTSQRESAFMAGLLFSASCYMLSNMELLNGLAFFCVPLGVLFVEKYLDERLWLYGIAAALFLVLEFYFSAYHFVFGLFITACIVATSIFRRRFQPFRTGWVQPAGILLAFMIFAVPIVLKLTSPALSAAYNPLDDFEGGNVRFSLGVNSLITSLPGNLIYTYQPPVDMRAFKMTYYANLGVVCLLLVLIGLSVRSGRRVTYLVILLGGLMVAMGPYIQLGGRQIAMPLKALYSIDAVERFIRIPGRFFIIVNFAVAILAAYGFKRLQHRLRYPLVLALFLGAVFILENFEFPPHRYDHSDILAIPAGYRSLPESDSPHVLAELPSSIFTDKPFVNDISEFNREYRYQYWQTRHLQHTINGSASYFPESRMVNNTLMQNIQSKGNLELLIDRNGLDFIVFHKALALYPGEAAILDYLNESPTLKPYFEDERTVVFKTKEP